MCSKSIQQQQPAKPWNSKYFHGKTKNMYCQLFRVGIVYRLLNKAKMENVLWLKGFAGAYLTHVVCAVVNTVRKEVVHS